jgi:UTP--glucose-1-phosphate uridylyltransferase
MKAVVTMAGEGTRMLPVTIGLRKEMLPLFYRGENGNAALAPVAHLAVHSLYKAGVTDITMVVGRDVESVLRYFTPDESVLRRHAHHTERLVETIALHDMLSRIHFTWVVQNKPLGFGHAVLSAAATVGHEPFLLHAADAMLLEREQGTVLRMMAALREKEEASVVLFVRKVADPRRYGVVTGVPGGRWEGHSFLKVSAMEEKPVHPKSSWAATALYSFGGEIFDALKEIHSKKGGELEVTSGISQLISTGHKVLAIQCNPAREKWLSVGSPEGYYRAVSETYGKATRCSP